jgi:uncharacterized membrane protein YraQ (UPF0718 family)
MGALLWVVDFIYRTLSDISYMNREQCILYKMLPRPAFLVYEYLFETLVIVFVGVFIAVLLGRGFARFQKFFPRNPLSAFVYASVIPVCACAVIPLLSSMKGKLKFSTTMSFVLAAPLLSPYIIVLSFSVLGLRYGVLRILSSFALVMVSVLVLTALHRKSSTVDAGLLGRGCDRDAAGCGPTGEDVYLQTFGVFRRLLPYLLVAGAIGLFLEYLGPRNVLLHGGAGEGPAGILMWILVGTPLYFCNGAEVLFLRPLMSHGFPMGTGIAFSLTSTAICTTSIAMLLRTIGTRETLTLIVSVILTSLGLALVLNSLA